jgi:hypothetical protein
MSRLGDRASILRSKNAGPLTISFDVMFASENEYSSVKESGVLTPALIGKIYGVDQRDVDIIYYDIVTSLKVSIPRRNISGSLEDDDIYGCQQQMPLYNIVIP